MAARAQQTLQCRCCLYMNVIIIMNDMHLQPQGHTYLGVNVPGYQDCLDVLLLTFSLEDLLYWL